MTAKELERCAISGCIRIQGVLALQKQLNGKSDGVTLLPAEAIGLFGIVAGVLANRGDRLVLEMTDEDAIEYLADLPSTTN